MFSSPREVDIWQKILPGDLLLTVQCPSIIPGEELNEIPGGLAWTEVFIKKPDG